MLPYVIAFSGMGAVSLLVRPAGSTDRAGRAVVAVLSMLPILGLVAFRAHSIGIDVPSYLAGYRLAPTVNILKGEGVFDFEPGFILYMQGMNWLGLSPDAFIALTSVAIALPVVVIVARYSEMPALSMYIYATFGLYVFSFSGLRQSLAIGLCLISFTAIHDGRFRRFLTLVLVASQLHLSALAFLPAYWAFRFGARGARVLVGAIMIVATVSFRSLIFPILASLYRDSPVELENTGAYTLLLALIVIWAGSFLLADPGGQSERITAGTQNLLLIAILFQALAGVSSVVGRTAFYYMGFLLLLLPALVKQQSDPAMRLVLVSLIVLSGATLFAIQASAYDLIPYST